MSERASKITSIFHSALGRSAAERSPFLDGACGEDLSLRKEVEALLSAHEQAGSFIDSPAVERAALVLTNGQQTNRTGETIGPYKIISTLGAGGMGVVYKAHDTRLDREVALKLLPDGLNDEAESVRRFQQEARAASALNHPNILSIFDFGEHESAPYIVSELLIGETLREKLKGTALPLRKTLDYALQTARGLAAAQDSGIVHRDLKPENLFITKDGRVKILDFGIAKLIRQRAVSTVHSEAPTLVNTDPGMVIGTAGYMSPEQVRGLAVDHRSDIFSFGTILYEMLAGRRAFEGTSIVETLNSILKEEPPDFPSTSRLVAPEIARVVWRCLEKQPEARFQSASDLAFAVESLTGTQSSGRTNAVPASLTSPHEVGHTLRDRLVWIAAALLLVTTVALAVAYFRRGESRADTMRFSMLAPEKTSYRGELALSPDGRYLAFVVEGGSRSLWVRALDSVEARELPGTSNALLPFWSPDSRFIGFFTGNKLMKTALAGGSPQVLAQVTVDARGGTWSPDGTIVFAPGPETPLMKISEAGGSAVPTTELDQALGQSSHRWPSFLPDGRHFLYFSRATRSDAEGIYIGSVDATKGKFLLNSSVLAAYAAAGDGATGYLLTMRDKRLMAQPFDAERFQLTGEPSVVAEDVLSFPGEDGPTAYAAFSASANGHLAYLRSRSSLVQMGWFDRTGKSISPLTSPALIYEPMLSPDGKRVAFGRNESSQLTDIWLLDLAHDTTTRFTFDAAFDVSAVWAPDGSRIFFASNRDPSASNRDTGKFNLYQKISSGAGSEELLLKTDNNTFPDDCFSAKDGDLLLYESDDPKTKLDLWVLPLTGERKPYVFLKTEFNETHAQFSPDGRFIAYVSDESGHAEVYVQSFPAAGGKWQISTGGGDAPQWRADGRELFYMAPGKTIMAVPITTGNSVVPGSPVALFATHISTDSLTGDRTHFAVAADGQRFLINNLLDEGDKQPITLVLNWPAALKP